MVNMTLSIPEKLQKEMHTHSEIKWSEIARQSFEKKIRELKWMDEALKESSLTKKEAEDIGHKIKHEMRKRFK
ncbi:hypothetical protein HZA98_02355 [Candidatus Woesearchaeota archaeon]|nr:hypothetical protein [Candidatus Woesearchaeota archaeon]